jgi:uncharacterized protein DUF3592
MFNFIAQITQAYNQVGLFIGALVCLGIGGFILGDALYWRVHASRASGTIVGVIAKNGVYTPVYRYALQSGQTHLAKSNTGSGWIRGKETGRVVSLMISAHNPTQAQEANNYLFDLIGLVFLVPGIWLGYTAITAYSITPMTWLMAVAMLVYLAERGYRILIPKGQRVSIEEWKKQHHIDNAAIDPAEVKPIEGIVSAPDVRQAQQKQLQNYRKAVPFLGLFAIILFSLGIYASVQISRLEAKGLRATGEVVRLKPEYSSGSGGGHYSYYAIVRFRTDKNVTVEFKDNVGSDPPTHRAGDKVTVLYLPNNPQRDAIIDRGIWWNWAMPAIVFISAAFLLILTGILRKQYDSKKIAGDCANHFD